MGGCCGWKVSRGLFEHEPCRRLVSGIGPDGQGKWSRANSRSLKNAHTELSWVPNSFASLLVTAIEQQAKYVELLEA